MKRTVALVVLAATFSVALIAAPDVTGTWVVEFKRTAADPFDSGPCTFQQDAGMLKGHCGTDPNTLLLTGRIDDRTVSWEFKSGIAEEITAKFVGELDKDATAISGTWSFIDASDGSTGTGLFEARRR